MDDEAINEVFAPLGPVMIRRMFSGKGIYFRGVIVAILLKGELRLKADTISAPDFAAAGAVQWIYDGHRGPVSMPYWSIPDDAHDNADAMKHWLRLAFEAALRAPIPKKTIKPSAAAPKPRRA